MLQLSIVAMHRLRVLHPIRPKNESGVNDHKILRIKTLSGHMSHDPLDAFKKNVLFFVSGPLDSGPSCPRTADRGSQQGSILQYMYIYMKNPKIFKYEFGDFTTGLC